MTPNHLIFDRRRLRMHRDRAAAGFERYDFLIKEMTERLCDRLSDTTRTFPTALNLGAGTGEMSRMLQGRGGIEMLVQADLSPSMIRRGQGLRVVADEEYLPFADNSFDLVVSAGSLHWVNDLPGALVQINRALKPGGLFLGMFLGGSTLSELRQSLEQAEQQIKGGVSPRISPFVDVRDAGALLQRAGFELPVADSEILTISYAHPLKLLHDLRGMGEASVLAQGQKNFMPSALLSAAIKHYAQAFTNDQERVLASFELVGMTGWKKK